MDQTTKCHKSCTIAVTMRFFHDQYSRKHWSLLTLILPTPSGYIFSYKPVATALLFEDILITSSAHLQLNRLWSFRSPNIISKKQLLSFRRHDVRLASDVYTKSSNCCKTSNKTSLREKRSFFSSFFKNASKINLRENWPFSKFFTSGHIFSLTCF